MNAITNLTEAESKLIEMAGDAPIAEQIAANGLPTRRVEAWHYTDLRNLLKQIPDTSFPVGGGERSRRNSSG